MRLIVVFVVLLQTGPIHTACDNCRPHHCSSGRCHDCNDGYYVSERSCHQCHQGCARCWSWRANQCHSCKPGYLFNNNRCLACPDNCEQCSRTENCHTCNTGYYLHDNECCQCSGHCVTCTTSASACGTCKVGHYGSGCTTRCSDGCYNRICHEASGNCTHGCRSGYYGLKCDRCPSNCLTCTSSTSCTSCSPGYFGSKCNQPCLNCKNNNCSIDGRCTDGCIDRHYQGYTGCDRCPSNCLTCTSSTSSTSCSLGHFGSRCDQPCRNCKNNKCSIDGRCMDGCIDSHYQGYAGCDLCPGNCLTCTSSSSCTSCNRGYFGSKCDQPCRNCKNNKCSIDGRCMDGCIDGHYQGPTSCDPCPNNCLTCISSTSCTSCSPGHLGNRCDQPCRNCKNNKCSIDGRCMDGCIDRHYQGPTSCDPCPNNCLTCISSTSCTSCSPGHLGNKCDQPCRNCKNNRCSIDGRCTDGCIDSHYQRNAGCDLCPGNCLACTSSSSYTSCSPGYFGNKCDKLCINCKNNKCSIDGRCMDGCIDGHYQGLTGCDRCPSYCLTCISYTSCTSCSPRYFGSKCDRLCRNCKKNKCSIEGRCTDGCMDRHHQGATGCDPCPTNCLQSPDTNSTCWQHNGICTGGCMLGFTGPDCTEDAGSGEKQQGFDLLLHAVIPALGLLIVILLVIVGGCAATKRRNRRTEGDPGPQGAIYITAQSDANASNTYAHVYLDGDITGTPTQVSLYITAQSDSTTNNAYAEVHSDGDLTDTLTGPSLTGITATRLRTRDVSTPVSDREPSRLYTSIDEVNTEGGTGASSEVDPVYWLPAGVYESLGTRENTSDTYTSLQADGTARIPAIQRK